MGHSLRLLLLEPKLRIAGAQDGGDPGSPLIVSGVIAMARALGLKTIAEGIETAEQAAMLAREGSDEVQGILVC